MKNTISNRVQSEHGGIPLLQPKKESVNQDSNNQILFIEKRVPTYDQDSGSLRLYSILKILSQLDYKVTFIPDHQNSAIRYVRALQALGIKVLTNDNVANFLQKSGSQFSVVILSRPDEAYKYYPYVRAYAVNSKIIFDTVDAHWIRYQRAYELYKHQNFYEYAQYYRAIEGLNAQCSDLVLTVTEKDRDFFEEFVPRFKIAVLPNIHNIVNPEKSFKDRKDLMFIGGFYHHPNVDAIVYFVKKIFPLIRKKIEHINLIVVGSNPPNSIKSLSGSDIKVTGYVEDVQPYFESSRVFVSPLRYGAGMKGKIGQSMSHGLPVVTTSIGAEGMGIIDGENALVADEPEIFANAVVRLYTNKALWDTISANSVKHIEENFSLEVTKLKLKKIMDSVLAPDDRVNDPWVFIPAVASNNDAPGLDNNHQSGALQLERIVATGKTITRGKVLVVGVYLADKVNNIEHLVKMFDSSREWEVTQRWAAIGSTTAAFSDRVNSVTELEVAKGYPKFVMINKLIQEEQLKNYDFFIISDDDISLPPGFLDEYLNMKTKYDFALAQPARTHNSYIDHLIVERLDGLQARRTRFIEIGPVVSFSRDALTLFFPFDVSVTPMGWGYDFAWPYVLEQNNLRSGIIDATPVEHSMRKTVSYYNYEEAKKQMEDYLSRTPHFSPDKAYTILESYT